MFLQDSTGQVPNGLNVELGRHRGKNDDRQYKYVGMNVKV